LSFDSAIRLEDPLVGKERVVIAGFLELPRVATCEEASSGRGALGVAVVGLSEFDALLCESVEMRGVDVLTAVGAEAVSRSIVGDQE